ncbi:hypothetical protein Scep_017781 [Stephania cephalantha]|uniref:Uncharacterized protein n=1 Tax=Stephania cephalantha TaxID=152367 RepID=A0AAP0IRI8_9MAGN
MYPSLPQYMPSPYTPTPYNYNMAYSGDPSFMNLLTMPQPHVPFPQPHAGKPISGWFHLLFLVASSEASRVKNQRKRNNLLDVIHRKTSYLNKLIRMYKHIVQQDKEYVRLVGEGLSRREVRHRAGRKEEALGVIGFRPQRVSLNRRVNDVVERFVVVSIWFDRPGLKLQHKVRLLSSEPWMGRPKRLVTWEEAGAMPATGTRGGRRIPRITSYRKSKQLERVIDAVDAET